jgi:hypothetical protein
MPACYTHGAFAGNNAAAELLGVSTKPYHQKGYVTCLDLGENGALFTLGWVRKVGMVGDVAKKTKQKVNTVWTYPPKAERAATLASADPERVTDVTASSSPERETGRASRWRRGLLNKDQPRAKPGTGEKHGLRRHLIQSGPRRTGSVALRAEGR